MLCNVNVRGLVLFSLYCYREKIRLMEKHFSHRVSCDSQDHRVTMLPDSAENLKRERLVRVAHRYIVCLVIMSGMCACGIMLESVSHGTGSLCVSGSVFAMSIY